MKRRGFCERCERCREIHGRGLCDSCYQTWWREATRNGELPLLPVLAVEAWHWYCDEGCRQWSLLTFHTREEAREAGRIHEASCPLVGRRRRRSA